MTKKHYIAIAKILASMTIDTTHQQLVNEFVKFFSTNAPNFNREKFLIACGVK